MAWFKATPPERLARTREDHPHAVPPTDLGGVPDTDDTEGTSLLGDQGSVDNTHGGRSPASPDLAEPDGRPSVQASLHRIGRCRTPDADPSTWLAPAAMARVILWLVGDSAGIVTGSAVMLSRGSPTKLEDLFQVWFGLVTVTLTII